MVLKQHLLQLQNLAQAMVMPVSGMDQSSQDAVMDIPQLQKVGDIYYPVQENNIYNDDTATLGVPMDKTLLSYLKSFRVPAWIASFFYGDNDNWDKFFSHDSFNSHPTMIGGADPFSNRFKSDIDDIDLNKCTETGRESDHSRVYSCPAKSPCTKIIAKARGGRVYHVSKKTKTPCKI